MTKRILALTLCVVMLCVPLFGCAKQANEDPGAYITMYLSDEIYDFDPAAIYYNTDAVNVMSLMYDTLFKLDENGKVKKSLVESYEIVEDTDNNEYYIEFTLKEAHWSTKDQITAEHVVFAWKRLVDFRNDYEAASLLFDVKNARAIKEGDVTVDDLGVEAVEDRVVKVSFEKPIDYDQFLLNLTCIATAPLHERYLSLGDDWAKKGSSMPTSGPFKLGKFIFADAGVKNVKDDNATDENGNIVEKSSKPKKISSFYLERNQCYYRDFEKDKLTKSVKPYRLLVDCTKTDEEILDDYKNGKLFYVGNIPLSLRTGDNAEFIQKEAEVSNALSTFAIQLNENALVSDGANGTYLFANPTVRQALSLAIDREAIAKAVVFAEAANAFVPNGVFDTGRKDEFRTSKQAKALLSTSANVEGAKKLLSDAGIKASKYSFTIKVAAHDEVHVAMTEMICAAWAELGFKVKTELVYPVENNDYSTLYENTPTDVCDDLFVEAVQRGKFEAIALDVNAFTADAYSMLSNYAYAFSGGIYADAVNDIYEYDTHITGYDSVRYNIMMEAIYYIPYFASLDTLGTDYLVSHLYNKPYEMSANATMRKFATSYETIKAALQAEKSALTEISATADTKETYAVLETVPAFLRAQLDALLVASKLASKDIVAAGASKELTSAAQTACESVATSAASIKDKIAELDTAIDALKKAIDELTKATQEYNKVNKENPSDEELQKITEALNKLNDATTAYGNALTSVTTSATNIIDSASEAYTAADAAIVALEAIKNGTSKQTLKEAIEAVYAENNITPSTKSADWSKQKATLLHKAEEILMEDLPVIPVVYNQNAVLIHKDLSRVQATYYAPATFQKTGLKGYKKYVYYNSEAEKTESIFKSFPEIKWDEIEG